MAGRATSRGHVATRVQLPAVADPTTQDAFKRLLEAVHDLQDRAQPLIFTGAGTPEGRITAPVGALYTRTDGAVGATLYVKETGTGATGWTAK